MGSRSALRALRNSISAYTWPIYKLPEGSIVSIGAQSTGSNAITEDRFVSFSSRNTGFRTNVRAAYALGMSSDIDTFIQAAERGDVGALRGMLAQSPALAREFGPHGFSALHM